MVLGAASPTSAVIVSQKDYNQHFERLKLKAPKADQKVRTSSIKKEADKFSEDILVVKYHTPLTNALHNQAGTRLIKRVAALGYDIVQVYNKNKLPAVLQAYAKLPEVSSVSRSAFFKQAGSPDLKTDKMYYLNTLHVDEANQLTGQNPVRVAMIDSGVDANHPELKNKLISNYNVQNPLKKGVPESHGTHVAGILAAEKNNSIGGYGINPNIQLISIDVYNRSTFANDFAIAEGILEAIRQKAQVINFSLSSWYPSPIVEDAVKKALAANITIVAAAGNSGINNMEYPAAFEGVISVGAVDSKNQLADFSTYGPSIDVVAPGVGIYSTAYDYDKQSSFAVLDGTSMAAPMVTGAVTLLLSKYPSLTPYQINYILNETARDLGTQGFDIKYGHGLVDPLAALQYPVKNAPKNPASSHENVLKTAKPLDVLSTISQFGAMTRLNQIDWYKLDVKKEDDIQTKLAGSKNYNYQYDLLFYPNGETKATKKVTVNDVPENKVEGHLFHVPEDGTLVIGIKDVNGNYSENSQSKYDLQIDRYTEKLDDQNTKETAVYIDKLPFQSLSQHGQMYFTNELNDHEEATENEQKPIPGDSDFFHFVAPETNTVVQIKLSEVPGIDSSINLYMMEESEEVPPELQEYATEQMYLIDLMNQNGFGDGENLSFEAIPGKEYVIEVTNKPNFDPLYLDIYGQNLDLERSYTSNISYNLSIESIALPADEDIFPIMNGEESATDAIANGDIQAYYEKKEELQMVLKEPAMPVEDQDFATSLKEHALPHHVGQIENGYFQYMGDEDYFQFTPAKNAIYQFSFEKNEQHEIPWLEILTYDEQMGSLAFVGSNWMYSYDNQLTPDFYIGLKANQTYYIKLANELYRTSSKGYSFTSKVLVENTIDKFEDNDSYEKATNIGLNKVVGNFSTAQDMDIYYFEPTISDVYGFSIQALAVQGKYEKLPKELLAPLDPVMIIIEDSNRNKKLDKEEEGNFILTNNNFSNSEERGAFKGLKGAGYFIVVFNYLSELTTITPYELTLAKATQVDEDGASIVHNNLPTKPILFRQISPTTAAQKAYLNITDNKGDIDYFHFVAAASSTYKIQVDVPSDLDAVVTVYDGKGQQIAVADQYGSGDYEALTIALTKGSYFIKVEDSFGNASISPYKVIVTK